MSETERSTPRMQPVAARLPGALWPSTWLLLSNVCSSTAVVSGSVSVEPEHSSSLGRGLRCGFLGMLHMEVVHWLLDRLHELEVIQLCPPSQSGLPCPMLCPTFLICFCQCDSTTCHGRPLGASPCIIDIMLIIGIMAFPIWFVPLPCHDISDGVPW